MVQYLVEEQTFRHQPVSPHTSVTTSGTQPDGTPTVVEEPTPNAMAAFQSYLDDKAGDSWELIQFERLSSSSTTYKFLFIFIKP